MNLLDVVIMMSASSAAIGGWRVGVRARWLAWVCTFAALGLGVRATSRVVAYLGTTSADTRLLLAALWLLLLGLCGQASGAIITAIARARRSAVGERSVDLRTPVPGQRIRQHQVGRPDRIAGATVGVAAIAMIVWMLTPALFAVVGWPADAAHDSSTVQFINEFGPDHPRSLLRIAQDIAAAIDHADANVPIEAVTVGPVPQRTSLTPETMLRVRASVVKIAGIACGVRQTGTGWAFAHDLVMTNAHVVAGMRSPVVVDARKGRHRSEVVAFDAERDIAVVRAQGGNFTPLMLAPDIRIDGGSARTFAIFGHPHGGALRIAPASFSDAGRMIAVGPDIYQQGQSRRRVIAVGARLAPGDSGSPVVDREGFVVAMAFAIAPTRPIAYALESSELRVAASPLLRSGSESSGTLRRQTSGACLPE